MNSVKFVGINSGWMCGINGNILHSTNGGSNWANQQSPVFFDLTQIFMYDQYTGWITGSGGRILKTTNGGIIGLVPISEKIPNSFSLSQNYPNPFNPVTKIRFAVPTPLNPTFSQRGEERSGGGFVTLTVYDLLGREVAVLVNEQLKPGTYEVEFSATGGGTSYSSGVYFYKLTSADASSPQANPLSITKRMVLVK
jgi:hypothetical protein